VGCQLFREIIKCGFDFTLVAKGDWFLCDDWFPGKLHYRLYYEPDLMSPREQGTGLGRCTHFITVEETTV